MKKQDYLQNIILFQEEKRIKKRFDKKKIKYRFLKGIHFIRQHIPNFLNFKKVGDIDILVNSSDFSSIMNILFSLGYHQAYYPSREEEEIRVRNLTLGTVVELHINAFNFTRSLRVDTLFLPFKEKDTTKLTIKILNDQEESDKEYTLLYLLMHFALNHCFRGEDRLKSLYLLLNSFQKSDWKKWTRLIKYYHLQVYFKILTTLIKFKYKKNFDLFLNKDTYYRLTYLYERLFFFTFPLEKLNENIDVISPKSYKQEKRFFLSLNLIKIICSQQTLFNKIVNCFKLFFFNPFKLFKYIFLQ